MGVNEVEWRRLPAPSPAPFTVVLETATVRDRERDRVRQSELGVPSSYRIPRFCSIACAHPLLPHQVWQKNPHSLEVLTETDPASTVFVCTKKVLHIHRSVA